MKPLAAAAAALFVMATASMAQGAQRYAAPAGTGAACSQAAPCELKEAITKAAGNDEVIVTGGDYSVSATLTVPPGANGVHIHGDYGAPMPRIHGTVNSNLPISNPQLNGRLSYLDIRNEATSAYGMVCGPDGQVDRVRVAAIGTTIAQGVIQIGDCMLRDSVVLAEGSNAIAILGNSTSGEMTGLVRNVTAIAKGSGSTGVVSTFNGIIIKGSFTLDLKNVIAQGEKADLSAIQGLEGPGHMVVSHSNFDVATTTGASKVVASENQTAPPAFVNAAGSDFRQAAGSPTIDAGSNDQIGALDLDGNPRTLGSAPDIGAFEFVPPPAPAASIESLALSAKSFRTVNAGGAILSAARKKVPVGTTVTYSLSAAGTVSFTVERKVEGRRVGKKCRKATRANRKRKKCVLYQKVKGGFPHTGAAGQSKFKFSGRTNGKALKPGRYRLVGSVGESVRRAGFKIVR